MVNINKFDSLRGAVAFLLCILVVGCSTFTREERAPSPEVGRFIKKYEIDRYTLDVALMPPWTASPKIPLRRGAGEMYRLPQERVSLEAFIFDVYYDRDQGLFWVKRTSPAASLEELFGPVKISSIP